MGIDSCHKSFVKTPGFKWPEQTEDSTKNSTIVDEKIFNSPYQILIKDGDEMSDTMVKVKKSVQVKTETTNPFNYEGDWEDWFTNF